MKTITLLFASIISTSILFSQLPAGSGSISGSVIDSISNTPAEYATISLFGMPDSNLVSGTIANAEGFYVMNDLPLGEYYLTIDFIGYHTRTIRGISLTKENKAAMLPKAWLIQDVEQLGVIEVEGEKSYIEYRNDKKVVNVSKHMNAAGGSAADVLENVPSVNVDIDGNVSLRGSSNFKVLIDGKPSLMDGNDLLKQLPASVIENIEIITNPSAKYDPDGTSGIINIIMKKGNSNGFNGIVNLSAGTNYNTELKYGADFSLNYRQDKINYFLSGNYNIEPISQETKLFTKTYFDSLTRIANSTTERVFERGGNNIKGGADFYMRYQNTLSVSAEIGQFIFNRGLLANYRFYNEGSSENSTYEVVEDGYDILGNYLNANLTYQKNFAQKGHKLDIAGVFSRWDGENNEASSNFSTAADWITDGLVPQQKEHDQTTLSHSHKWTIDYTRPINDKHILEGGLNLELQQTDLQFNYWDYDKNQQQWVLDSASSNAADFMRNIYAAYTTWSSNLAGISYKLGLRAEHSTRVLEQVSLHKEYRYDATRLFPSASFSKDIGPLQTIQVSYSRRINRPQPWLLNPYSNYRDNLIVSEGNPELQPEMINSYEANYIKRFETGSFFSAGLYYRQTNNAMTQSMRLVDTLIFVKMDNLNVTKASGLELSGNLIITKWWSIYAGANAFLYGVDGLIGTETIDTTMLSYTFNANNTFRLGKNTRLQLNLYYNGPSIALQGVQKGFITGGFAIRHDFWNRKATLTLNARDPFRWFDYNLLIDNNSYYSDFSMKSESVFRLSFSYKINNYQRRTVKEESIQMEGGGGVL